MPSGRPRNRSAPLLVHFKIEFTLAEFPGYVGPSHTNGSKKEGEMRRILPVVLLVFIAGIAMAQQAAKGVGTK